MEIIWLIEQMTDNHSFVILSLYSTLPSRQLIFFLRISLSALQLLAFLQGLFTFYHEGYEVASEFEPYKQQLQFNLQNVSVCLYCKPLDCICTWYHSQTMFIATLLYVIYLPLKRGLRGSIWKSVLDASGTTCSKVKSPHAWKTYYAN